MEPGLELVAGLTALDTALNIFSTQRPDVTLMDLDLPSNSGIDAIIKIRALEPGAWVIGMLTHDDDLSSSRASQAGAAAVIRKDQLDEVLVPMILSGRRQAEAS